MRNLSSLNPVPPQANAPPNPDDLLELDNQFCFALHAASRRVVRGYRLALEALDITYPQYLVMLVVWSWDRVSYARPTVSALGERLDLDSGTLTPLLRRLEQKGLIVRKRGTEDERELFVYVTRTGRDLKTRAAEIPRAMVRESPLPLAQIVSLRDQLKVLHAALTRQQESAP